MTYQETLDWMFAQLPMYQRQGKAAFKKDLTNSVAFSKHLDYPEKQFKSIHVGGTNGKGSTSHMIASILQEAGYKVGLYTSPHLKSFTERIRINGKEISKDKVVEFISVHKSFLEEQRLSFFEMTVGMAFDYFASEKVDIAIVEVGLGGRLDSTNIITPEISVITNIGLDHTQFLGETLQEIAIEKAGIIKRNTPVVIGEYQSEVSSVFRKKALIEESTLHISSESNHEVYETDLLGAYQRRNIITAVTTVKNLHNFPVDEIQIASGLLNVVKNTDLLGRWQVLDENPKVICDTAHNKEGLKLVMKQLKKESYKNLHIVLGVVNDKKLEEILPMFPTKANYYFCKPAIPRGMASIYLQEKAKELGLLGTIFSSVNEATTAAKKQAQQEDIIFIGGSTFVVAEVL